MSKWQTFIPEESYDIPLFINRLTLDAFSKAVFHQDLNVQADPNGTLCQALGTSYTIIINLDCTVHTIQKLQGMPFPKMFKLLHPFAAYRYAQSRKVLLALLHQMMDNCRKSG